MTVSSAVRTASSEGPLDLIGGVPVHPLVIHAAVVLVPLAALGVLLMAVAPKVSRRLGWLVALVGVAAAATCFVAKLSGEQLASRLGDPGFSHRTLGTWMPILATALAVVAVALWLVDRRQTDGVPAARGGLGVAVAVLAAVVAVANGYWVYRVGDSGARSVWTGRVATSELPSPTPVPTPSLDPSAAPTPAPTASAEVPGQSLAPTTSPAPAPTPTATFTQAQVGAHNSAADCWVIVGDYVYDLTGWIDQTPAVALTVGPACGTDASASFGTGADPVPSDTLSTLVIGSVAS